MEIPDRSSKEPVVYLKGRIQIETALSVLNLNGVKSTGQEFLKWVLEMYDRTEALPELPPVTASVALCDETGQELKNDILAAAALTAENPEITEDQRIAAQGLLEILREQE
jgi:hypothetical protein